MSPRKKWVKPLRVFSWGGGVQSMAVLVLAAQGKVQYDQFLFSNVGEDSENPLTLQYFREVALPFAEAHGLTLLELHKIRRGLGHRTLYGELLKAERSVAIPVWMPGGGKGHRSCTYDFKISVIAKHTKRAGMRKWNPATVGIGFSLDEIHRIKDSEIAHQVKEYPLIDLGLTRRDCEELIRAAGVPVPPKSSCWFCPYKKTEEWRALKRDQPELFRQAIALEEHLTNVRLNLGRDEIFLSAKRIPLEEVVADSPQLPMFVEDDACDGGYCMV